MLLWVLAVLIILALLLPRVLPVDPARWHVPIEADADRDMMGGAVRILPAPPDALSRLSEIAKATPRTKIVAGSAEEGRITFETRSLIFGFPDYTTAEMAGDQLKLFARLRIGRSDLGVNRRRLEAWIAALQS